MRFIPQEQPVRDRMKGLITQSDVQEMIKKNIPLGYMLADNKGQVFEFNQAAERITGYSKTDVVGRAVTELFGDFHTTGLNEVGESEIVFTQKSGKTIIVSMTSFSLINDSGASSFTCHVFSDVSRRLKIETERKLLLAMLAHDIKNPANASLQLARRLFTGQVGPISDQQKKYLQTIQSGLQKIAQFAEDFLVFTKADSSHTVLLKKPYDLVSAVSSAIDMFKVEAEQRNIRFSLRIRLSCNRHPWGDDAMLNRVLANIIENSLKYSKKGGEIIIKVSSSGARCRCSVADHGIGISSEVVKEIFTPFFRGPGTNIPGTGLGLAIVKNIIESHDGRIQLKSRPGKGTVVSFTLPLSPV